MSDNDYEKLLFQEMLRKIFASTDDATYYYLLGAIDAAQALSDKLAEVDHAR